MGNGTSEKGREDRGLLDYGWGAFFARQRDDLFEVAARKASGDLLEGRVVFSARGIMRVITTRGELLARSMGALNADVEMAPSIGDWVLVEELGGGDGRIHSRFERRSVISRRAAGEETREQVVAANVDAVFIVMGLDGDYNLRRLERFTVMAQESGAEPVVVLTKSDLCEEVDERRIDAMAAAPGVPVVVVNSLQGEGLDPLDFYLGQGKTVVLVGSSGVGKSTLINRLMGETVMRTGSVRSDDDRGRHTTTHRQMLRLPSGAMVIDNPGVREVQLWVGADSVHEAFDDVASFAGSCRFRDCAHEGEPGCAVEEAVSSGALESSRLESYRGLLREQKFLELKQDDAARRRADRALGAHYRNVLAEKRNRR